MALSVVYLRACSISLRSGWIVGEQHKCVIQESDQGKRNRYTFHLAFLLISKSAAVFWHKMHLVLCTLWNVGQVFEVGFIWTNEWIIPTPKFWNVRIHNVNKITNSMFCRLLSVPRGLFSSATSSERLMFRIKTLVLHHRRTGMTLHTGRSCLRFNATNNWYKTDGTTIDIPRSLTKHQCFNCVFAYSECAESGQNLRCFSCIRTWFRILWIIFKLWSTNLF